MCPVMYYRCYAIAEVLKKDKDHFSVFVGMEGGGKSWNAAKVCAVISPTFQMSNICYKLNDFLDIIKTAKKGDSIMLDEGAMFLFSREAMGDTNKVVVKLFTLIRQLNLHICICIPLFHTIDSYVRDHRIHTLVDCIKRGKGKIIVNTSTAESIKKVSKEGARFKNIRGIKLANGSFSFVDFANIFPTINDLNEESYKGLKLKHLHEFIAETKEKTMFKDVKQEYVKVKEYADKFGVSTEAVRGWIREGRVKGGQIGRMFMVKREEFEKNPAYGDCQVADFGENSALFGKFKKNVENV